MLIQRIIIVTGSKGGGGKTPVSLAISTALEDMGVPVLAADFNFNNADLLTILHGSNLESRSRQEMIHEKVYGTDNYWQISDNMWLTAWNFITKTGMPSSLELWEKIQSICSIKFDGKQPKIMVIDTNLTLPLLTPPLTDIQRFENLPPIEVWHLWSPSITLQLGEQERFTNAIAVLGRFNKGFENRMHHVFTPRHYNSTSFFGTMSSLTRGEFNVTKNVKFKQANPKPILFSEIKDVLFASFLPNILNYSEASYTSIEDLLSQWLQNILTFLKSREYRTNNVIVVPTIIHKIALLVEELTLKPRRTLKSIRKDLGSLYEIIVDHFVRERQGDILKLKDQLLA